MNSIEEEVNKYNSKRLILGKKGCCSIHNDGKAYFEIIEGDSEKIVIPDFVYGIERGYYDTDNIIEEIIFKENVKYLYSGCFSNLAKLKYISDLDKATDTTDIDDTFFGCKSLIRVPKLPASVTRMDNTFGCCEKIESIDYIPEKVSTMNGTFTNCLNLKNVCKLPNKVKRLSYCFSGCESLKKAPEIPDSVIYMNETFRFCDSLENFNRVPELVDRLNCCFEGCKNLKGTIVIDANLEKNRIKNVFNDTFSGIKLTGKCTILKEIALTSIDNNVFVKQ